MEFSPLTAIAGTNASGKSNLFDALQLLSRLADTDLKKAFSEQRGDASELFTQYGEGNYARDMYFAVEMLVHKEIQDNWGGEAVLKYTRLRYELRIRREMNDRGLEDLFVVYEHLENLKHTQDEWVKKFIPKPCRESWRPKVHKGKRGIPYIYTEVKEDIPTIIVPQDGRTGNKREFPANNIIQTILSGFNSVDFPHVFAAKEEMQSWKFLQLNPEHLRKPSPYYNSDEITQSGENLAAALHRIKVTDEFALKDISRKLNNLLPNFVEATVQDDKANKQFIIKLKNEDGREFSSRVLSEGTLRLMALCVFQFDEKHNSLLCFEEPENGIHPGRMEDLANLLLDLSVDFSNPDTPLRQVIVNTHSPVLLGKLFHVKTNTPTVTVWLSKLITSISEIGGKKLKLNISKILPIEKDSSQLSLSFSESERKLTIAQAKEYLQNVDSEMLLQDWN
jgi:predicted ATPase